MEIYKTTNKITGEYYIGLNTTSNPNYLGSGVEIKKQVEKYGKKNFIKEILCLVTSNSTDENILRKIEHAYIYENIHNKKCLNRSIGYTKGKKEVQIKYVEVEKIVEIEKIIEVEKIVKVEKIIERIIERFIDVEKIVKVEKIVYKEGKRPITIGRNLSALLNADY